MHTRDVKHHDHTFASSQDLNTYHGRSSQWSQIEVTGQPLGLCP
jgi:hypothetical protein